MKKIVFIATLILMTPAFTAAHSAFPAKTVDLSTEDIGFLTSCEPDDWSCNQARKATITIIKQILAELLVELAALKEAEASGIDLGEIDEDIDRTYSITSDLGLKNRDGNIDVRAQLIWDIYLDISPREFTKDYIDGLRIYFDEDDVFSAYVQLDGDTYPRWLLAVNLAQAELDSIQDRRNLEETLIHEFAHILTLNQEQTNAAITRESDCRFYYAEEGCYLSNSLMNQFFQEFWTDQDHEDHLDDVLDEDDREEREEIIEDFYHEYKDYFVSEYAASNPEEDLAESFAEFIAESKSDKKTVADEKTLFFYEYEDLVDLRETIRVNLSY